MNGNLVDAAMHLLEEVAYSKVLSGRTGNCYIRCRFCSGDNESETEKYSTQPINHNDGCKLAVFMDSIGHKEEITWEDR